MASVEKILASLLLLLGHLLEGKSAMKKEWEFENILNVKFHEDIVNERKCL